MVAPGHSVDGVDPARWEQTIDRVMGRVAAAFSRVEPRRTARDYVVGLLSDTERKNCWWLAENAGHTRPDAMQRLLRTANWDAEKVRDKVRSVVVEALAHLDGVLIVDETGFPPHERHPLRRSPAPVHQHRRRDRERPGRGVFVLRLPRGRALVDRRLYLPRNSWCADRKRGDAAGIPTEVGFATKPELAAEMIRCTGCGGPGPGGPVPMRSMAPPPRYEPRSAPVAWAMSWRWPATSM